MSTLQLSNSSPCPLGFHYFSDFDWQILSGSVKNEPKLQRQQNVSHYLETIVFCFSVGGQTHWQRTNEDHIQEKGEHWHKHVPYPLYCVYTAAALSLPLRCFPRFILYTRKLIQILKAFYQLKFKGTLQSHVSKTFFFASSLSRIYKSVMIHKSVCETHFVGSQEILFGEEYKDE